MTRLLRAACFFCVFVTTAAAFADSPKAPRRRAAKHDRQRSAEVRRGRVHVIDDVIIVGRPQRPLSVLDTAAERFRFPVGTARYSPADRRFLPADTRENW